MQGVVNGTVWLTQYYWIAHALLLVSLIYCLGDANRKHFLSLFFKGVFLLAIVESIIVILQFAGLVATANKYFAATGTWVNPNVTAMFLTMALPAMLFLFYGNKKAGKKLLSLFFGLVTVALVLLKCRTAFIGAVLIFGFVLNERYGLLQKIKARFTGVRFTALVLFTVLAVVCSGYGLYKSKQASADGRKLIWKISTGMIAEKPLAGYGYGSFEKNYNLAQGDYFAAGNGTEYEKANASFVHMGYNEFLQNVVEGGIIGLVLFMLLLASLLFTKATTEATANDKAVRIITETLIAKAAIVAFAVMSVLNFTIEAVPVMGMFVVYAAVVCSGISVNYGASPRLIIIKPILVSKRIITPTLFIICLLTGYSQILLAIGFTEVKRASDLSANRDYENADLLLEPLASRLRKSEIYWKTYALVKYRQKQYSEAASKFKQALLITSNPDLYLQAANCYEKIKENKNALDAYTIAKNIAPGTLLPRYQLMNFYLRLRDTANAGLTAYEIITIQPKVLSNEALYYKNVAKKIIAKNKL